MIAADAVTSEAWMLPSIHTAGFSPGVPIAWLVTVSSQISRPSYERPIDAFETRSGNSWTNASSHSVSSS
jgi:hypothetical protein